MSGIRTLTTTLLASALLVVTVGSAAQAAPSARRAPAPVLATPNGTVGISQPLTVVAPSLAGQTASVSFALNGAVLGTLPVTLNSQGGGTLTWTPPAAGAWTIDGVGALARAAAITVTAAPITTRTVLSTVNEAQVGVPTTMTVTVETTAGNADPQGTITVTNGAGTPYGSATLTGSGGGLSVGSFVWTPPSVGAFTFVATYNPAAGIGGAANATSSSSTDQIQVLSTQPLVTLRLPAVFTQGDPVTMTALVNQPNLGGSAAFLLNINGQVTGISGSIPQVNQQSTTTWTPSTIGNQFITADFTSSTTPPVSGSSTQVIAVVPQGGADPMSVQASGMGVLKVTMPQTLASGARTTLTATSGSGATVNLTESGPCLLVGATLIAPKGNGICAVTASSPGGGQFSGNSASFLFYVGKARSLSCSRPWASTCSG